MKPFSIFGCSSAFLTNVCRSDSEERKACNRAIFITGLNWTLFGGREDELIHNIMVAFRVLRLEALILQSRVLYCVVSVAVYNKRKYRKHNIRIYISHIYKYNTISYCVLYVIPYNLWARRSYWFLLHKQELLCFSAWQVLSCWKRTEVLNEWPYCNKCTNYGRAVFWDSNWFIY